MLLAFTFDPHEVLDLVDHAAHRGGVLQGAPAMALVEPEPLQGRLLVEAPPDRAAHLHDRDGLLVASPLGHHAGSRASASRRDRKSTRLNSSHSSISYAVFCLKKKKNQNATNLLKKKNKDSKTS